jgi:hypothetical protein
MSKSILVKRATLFAAIGCVAVTANADASEEFIRLDWAGPFFSDRYVPVTRQSVAEHATCRSHVRANSVQSQSLRRLVERTDSPARVRFDPNYVRIKVIGLTDAPLYVDMYGVVAIGEAVGGSKVSRMDLKNIRDALFPGCDPLFDEVK